MTLTIKQIKDLNRMNEAARKAELGSLLDDISGDTADIATINADILQLKADTADIETIKADILQLKADTADIATIKADILQLKADVLALQETIEPSAG